jgi:hypothetical protein
MGLFIFYDGEITQATVIQINGVKAGRHSGEVFAIYDLERVRLIFQRTKVQHFKEQIDLASGLKLGILVVHSMDELIRFIKEAQDEETVNLHIKTILQADKDICRRGEIIHIIDKYSSSGMGTT